MSTEQRDARRRRILMVAVWILAVLVMALAWAGVSLREIFFGG
jgi:hypothetical protein